MGMRSAAGDVPHRRRNHDRRHAEHRVGGKQRLHAHVGRQPRERSRDGPVQIHQARQVFRRRPRASALRRAWPPTPSARRQHRPWRPTPHRRSLKTSTTRARSPESNRKRVRQLHAPIEVEEQPETIRARRSRSRSRPRQGASITAGANGDPRAMRRRVRSERFRTLMRMPPCNRLVTSRTAFYTGRQGRYP